MSTTATTVDLSTKPTTVTYAAFTVTKEIKNEDGSVTKEQSIKSTMRDKEIEEAKKNGTFLFEQSFSYDLAGTPEGIAQLGIPEDEIVAIFNNGLKAKIGRLIVQTMQEQDANGDAAFQPVEGNFDARSYGAEVTGRRGMTDVEKAINTLKKLNGVSPDMIASFLAQLQSQLSPAAK